MIVAHGNGTPQSDISEAAAIRARLRRRAAARHRVQVGDRAPDRRGRHPRDDARARRADARRSCPASRRWRARSRLRRRSRVAARAGAAQQRRADPLSRLRGHQRRARRPRGLGASRAPMADAAAPAGRCGIDTRRDRAHRAPARGDAGRRTSRKLFSAQELADSGDGPGRAASLAARFAAKEACVKLFPREAALGADRARRISRSRATTTARRRSSAAPRAAAALGRHRIASIALSLTHDRVSASAVALAERGGVDVPLAGRLLYRFLPLRRDVILANLTRVYGDTRARRGDRARSRRRTTGICGASSASSCSSAGCRAARKAALVRVENIEAFVAAVSAGQGRARAHRPFRQLGGGDDRRHRQLSARCAAASISSAARSSRAGSTRSSRAASTRRASACIGKRGSLDRDPRHCSPPAT